MSYKVRIEKYGDISFKITNIGEDTFHVIYLFLNEDYTTGSDIAPNGFFYTNYRYMLGKEYFSSTNSLGELLFLGAGQEFLTVLTKNGSVTYDAKAMSASEKIEVELVPFSEVPTSDSCRLTSNRLSPPKFKLRKFFRFNPRKAMIGG